MSRGFTLVELLIATLVGAFTVLVAAQVAAVVVNQAAKGRQATDFNARARMVGRQMRHDIRMAGVGTTGAVTAAPNAPFSTIFSVQTNNGLTPGGGYPAFPVVVGVNNVTGGSVGGIPILANSDIVMMVVANGASTVQTTFSAPSGGNTLQTQNVPPIFADCRMVLIVDHSTPSGFGRSQVAMLNNFGPNSITINDTLQFTVQAQSDVMCARISTYWVSDNDSDGVGNYLHRSDLDGTGTMTTIGPVVIDYHGPQDVIAPGIIDLQIAYAFSGEIYRPNPPPTPYNPANAWAFTGGPGVDGLITTTFDWFEVRQVRFTIHAKRMRALDNFSAVGSGVTIQRSEDGGTFPVDIARSLVPEALTSAETLINLRYFDFGLPAGVAAEPY